MATKPIDPALVREAVEAVEKHGSISAAAAALDIPRSTFQSRYNHRDRDPGVMAAMQAVNTAISPDQIWAKTDKTGNLSYSVRFKPDLAADFIDKIREAVQESVAPLAGLPPRFSEGGGNLLVLDPADVHIGKLSIASETGFSYDSRIAEHRLIEGCRSLLKSAASLGVSRVLFVVGNDIAHIDSPRRTTTSGTPQDTDGSIFSIYRTAARAYEHIVRSALNMGFAVDILFCPSNHDWVLGFAIAQELAAKFSGHENVTATAYNVSENHRKYYRFGSNIMLFSHGDGAKEADLPSVMLVEARQHISECVHRYAYLHHYHHRIRNAVGVRPMKREKDHIAMTVSRAGAGSMEGDNMDILYVRSPSAPDGWHHRNGYLNRQAVEAFVHHPEEGRKIILTEWV